MVWNPETTQQGSESAVVFNNNQSCYLGFSDPNFSVLNQAENSMHESNVEPPVSGYQQSFNIPPANEYSMNPIDYNETNEASVYTEMNRNVYDIECEPSLLFEMANENETSNSIESNFTDFSTELTVRKSRSRQNSTDSTETFNSSTSGEIFNSNYTDTVSSVESTTFLIKPASETDEELHEISQPGTDDYCNEACSMSYSSSEILDEAETDEEVMVKNGINQETTEEREALLGDCIEGYASSKWGEDGSDLELREHEPLSPDDYVFHPLVPIHENKVISFSVDQEKPTEIVKITNNIVSVDESFLFHSNLNVADVECGKGGSRAVTMQNLHEKSSFLDLTEISKLGKACQEALIYLKDDINFGSIASLNNIANKHIEKDSKQSLSLIPVETQINVVKSNKHMKNLLALSFCITLLYIAIGSVRNLQSSINHEGGVGVLSMAFNSIGYLIGSLFSASIVLNFQPRKCLILNLIPNLLYIAANMYPTMWVMIPISFIQGIALAIIWNAISTYVTFLSRGRVQKTGKSRDHVSSCFFGILGLTYQSHLIIGNLIASLILMHGNTGNDSNETITKDIFNVSYLHDPSKLSSDEFSLSIGKVDFASNVSSPNRNAISHLGLCGAKFCHHFDLGGSGFAVSDETKYLLFGIYMGCIVIAVFIAVFFLEPLNHQLFTSSVKPLQKLKSQLSSLICFFADVKFLLLVPLLMYSVIQFGFVTAEFTKAFVTCSLGIHMVGYTMICFGLCGGISSYLSGLLMRFSGRMPLFIFAGITNLVLLIFMIHWHPNPESLLPFFIIMGLWGLSDGIWISQVSSLMGIIFPQKYEEAYAGLRIAQGLGPAIAFGYSTSLCMEVKIYIIIVLCIVSLAFYLLMEGLLRRKRNADASFEFKKTTV